MQRRRKASQGAPPMAVRGPVLGGRLRGRGLRRWLTLHDPVLPSMATMLPSSSFSRSFDQPVRLVSDQCQLLTFAPSERSRTIHR